MIRGLMTGEECAVVEPFLTTPSPRCGRPSANHPRVTDCMLWMCRTEWRNLAEAFDNWNSVWRKFCRWCKSGVWDVLLQGLADGGDDWDALQIVG